MARDLGGEGTWKVMSIKRWRFCQRKAQGYTYYTFQCTVIFEIPSAIGQVDRAVSQWIIISKVNRCDTLCEFIKLPVKRFEATA